MNFESDTEDKSDSDTEYLSRNSEKKREDMEEYDQDELNKTLKNVEDDEGIKDAKMKIKKLMN